MQVRAFLRQFRTELAADRIDDVAAMMTYYALFALFPMLLFVVTVTLLVLPDGLLDEAVRSATLALPRDIAALFTDQITRMEAAAGTGVAIGGAALALWGASRGASSLMTALNDLFEKEETRPWWKRQLTAIGTTVVIAALLLVAMSLVAAGAAVGDAIAERWGLGVTFQIGWELARWLISALLVMLVWAILYRWLPDTDAPFRIFTPGAAVGVALWFGITQLFGVYLDHFASYEQTYGALATVIVFMTWLWLSNLALLVGAEINDALAELRKDTNPAAARLAEREKASDDKGTGAPGRTPAGARP